MSDSTSTNTQALPTGTRIEEFAIERMLGSGGFGVTYLARDTSLGRNVVIKENLPAQFCFRDPHSLTVAPRHSQGEDAENFRWSLENFSREAVILASLDHPGIVKVLRSFEAFGTAYFVMPFVEGLPFDSLINDRGTKDKPFSQDELLGLITRMLDALGYLHDRGIYHRDIKPANILITNQGIPVLIDFGSARQRLSERSMTVVESAGYTPFEQLQSRGHVGPWSDLYALGATVARAITGETLPKATDRAFDDPWLPLSKRPNLRGSFSVTLLASIDKALESWSRDRWQAAAEWGVALGRAAPGVLQASLSRRERMEVVTDSPTPTSTDPLPGEEREFALTETQKIPMCWIPPGEFLMGSPDNEKGRGSDEGPLRRVVLDRGFWCAKHPTTQLQWNAVIGTRPSFFGRSGLWSGWLGEPNKDGSLGNLPVERVSWLDICGDESRNGGFLGKVNEYAPEGWQFDLPTEGQWEYACRAGTTSALNHGKELTSQRGLCPNLDEVAWYEANSSGKTHQVGRKRGNAWGLCDMHGNVWEWCRDRYQKSDVGMPGADRNRPVGGTSRVIRGGSWFDRSWGCRSACRSGSAPGNRVRLYGFRLVLVPMALAE